MYELDGDEMWLSVRLIRRTGTGDTEWDNFVGYRKWSRFPEVRSVDSWCSPCISGNYPVCAVDDIWDLLEETELLPVPESGHEYYLLFANANNVEHLPEHHRLRLLGFDLSDETWTSSLFNCAEWNGELEPIASRMGEYGLLRFEDAKMAQSILPTAWPGDPHGIVTIWALFEVTLAGHVIGD